MRGDQSQQDPLFTMLTPEQLVPARHPIRRIKPIVDAALAELSPTFDRMYASGGRPSIPPERLLKGCLLIALYSIRSERQFCERLQYDLLFKWFLDLNLGDPAFDPTTFSKNRERLLKHEVSRHFFRAVVEEARRRQLISDEHFTVDGSLLESWASLKSFRPKEPPEGGTGEGSQGHDRNPWVDFKGHRRSNRTHASTTDPEAMLAKKGRAPARLCFNGHVLMENRHGLVVDVELSPATGNAELEAGLAMIARVQEERPMKGERTLGGDKGYDVHAFVESCRQLRVLPHVAPDTGNRRRNIGEEITRHPGYEISQRKRKLVEEIFGWIKTVGGGRKLRYIGLPRNQLWVELTAATYNLVRIANLEAAAA